MGYVVAVLLLLVVVWFFLFRPKKSNKKKLPAEKAVRSKYHCVTVHFSDDACDAVKALDGQRILSAEVPVFPLPDCSAQTCNCRFQHHEERREDERRDAYHKAIDDFAVNTVVLKPRTGKDRRKN
ncbi:MAG: hypothetical protein OEY29_00710 [Gammaproteobacteria bacterium]|nr:hypothetical protein [Gammaproteobacteria bacterium]